MEAPHCRSHACRLHSHGNRLLPPREEVPSKFRVPSLLREAAGGDIPSLTNALLASTMMLEAETPDRKVILTTAPETSSSAVVHPDASYSNYDYTATPLCRMSLRILLR